MLRVLRNVIVRAKRPWKQTFCFASFRWWRRVSRAAIREHDFTERRFAANGDPTKLKLRAVWVRWFPLVSLVKENMTTLTRQDLNFGQGKTSTKAISARHDQTCHRVSRPMLTFCYFLLASGCRHLVRVPGGRHTPHTVRAWGLSLWNISEKKEVQCTCAGIRHSPSHFFFLLKKWHHRLTSKSVLFTCRCHVTQSWISTFKTPFTVWSHSLRRYDATWCWGWFRKTRVVSQLRVSSPSRMTQRRWWWLSWTKSTIQWKDLCLRFPNRRCCQSGGLSHLCVFRAV